MAKNATAQIGRFNVLCDNLLVLPLTDAVILQAAKIYGQLRQAGQTVGDGDILIAATCIVEGYALATNNTRHFARMDALDVQNWLD
jgi:predicted nucleic acid-binding protein